MSKGKGPEQTAAERYRIIAPLLDETLDRGKFIDTKKDMAVQHGISVRSVGRYYEAYQKSGFEGLKPTPPPKRDSMGLPENYQEIVNTAIELRKEAASRSVADIIKIMEIEGSVGKGILSRSTLQRHLQEAGFGAKQFKRYTTKGVAAKRFQKQHRCVLWQGDYSDLFVIPTLCRESLAFKKFLHKKSE